MDIQEILNKKSDLSEDEMEALMRQINEELAAVKESEPEKYLVLVRQINESLAEINKVLNRV